MPKKTDSQNKEKQNKRSMTPLNIMYTNPDTLSNKLNELEVNAEIYNADIILIAEYLSKNQSSKFEKCF